MNRTRAWTWMWISVLMLLHTVIYAHSASVADSARDLYWAWNIARGEHFPLEGPALAHVVHLSPIWFYLLSVPLFFSSAWLGAALWAGLIAALQYPLAFLLGKRLAGPECGVLLAGLCALPGWNITSYLVFNHTDAVEPATLFVLLCLLAWWQTRRPLWLVLLPISIVLGVHAHPVVYVTGVIATAVLGVDIWRRRLPWRPLLLGIFLACLLFVPYLIDQMLRDWPDWAGASTWVSGQSPLANLSGVSALLTGIWIRGPLAAWQIILNLGRTGQMVAWLQIALFSAGLLMAVVYARKQPMARTLLTAWLLAFTGIALLREVAPAYMTGTLYVFSATVAAYGLVRLGRWPRAIIMAIAPLVLLAIMFRLAGIATDGDLIVPNHALADVKRADLASGESFGYFPAWARGHLAQFLCAHDEPVTVHGPASIVLEQSYALATRMRCGKNNLYLGGQAPGAHYFGLPRHHARTLDLLSGEKIGSLRLIEAREVYHPAAPLAVPAGDVYPPRSYPASAPVTQKLRIPARPDEWLAITNLFLVWMPMEVEVRLRGERIEPALETRATHYFRCSNCAGDEWEITLTAPKPEYVEIVTLGLGPFPASPSGPLQKVLEVRAQTTKNPPSKE